MWRPSSQARRMPARTRSTIRFRSSSAMAPMMTTTSSSHRGQVFWLLRHLLKVVELGLRMLIESLSVTCFVVFAALHH
jgi:hypothetical protein